MKTMSIEDFARIAEVCLDTERARSAWARGVKWYAYRLLDELTNHLRSEALSTDDMTNRTTVEVALLDGAGTWEQYSWGGAGIAYIFDRDIAARLCTPSELKRSNNGRRRPNPSEEWLDVQTRALKQAKELVIEAARRAVAYYNCYLAA